MSDNTDHFQLKEGCYKINCKRSAFKTICNVQYKEENMLKSKQFLQRLLIAVYLLCIGNFPAVAEAFYVPAGTAAKPASLGEVEGILNFKGQAGEGSSRDAWFSFILSKRARVEIAVDQAGVTLDLRLVGSQGIDGVLISTAFSRASRVEYDVEAGTYLLRTYADRPTSYTITIKAN